MKTLKTIIAAISVLVLTGACNKAETVSGGADTVTVSYAVAVPATKAALGNGDAVNYVWYALYRADGSLVTEYPLQPFTDGKALCPVTMVRKQSYKVVFVAQHFKVEEEIRTPEYAVDAAKAVLAMPASSVANSDNGDLFCYVDEVNDYNGGNEGKKVTLTRLVAQVNYICSSEDMANAGLLGMAPTASAVTLTGVPVSYDILAGQPSERTMTVEYVKADLTGETDLLGTAFCFAGDNLTSAQLTLYKGEEVTTVLDVGNVPVKMNHRTNITGSFMTGTVDYQIGIDADDDHISHPLN